MKNQFYANSIKLFKAYTCNEDCNMVAASSLVRMGIISIDESGNIVDMPLEVAKFCYDKYGLDGMAWLQTFHESLNEAMQAPLSELMMKQIIHYMSTYGMEAMGFKAVPYIPRDNLFETGDTTMPSVNGYTVIRRVSQETLDTMILAYLKTLTSPSCEIVTILKDFVDYIVNIDGFNIDDVKSYEVKAIIYKHTGTVPQDVTEWLRYVVYSASGNTLLIKNRLIIQCIKTYSPSEMNKMLQAIPAKELATNFYRFKPLFLAMKTSKENAAIINHIRRLAVKYHKPMNGMTVANLSYLVSQNKLAEVIDILSKSSTRQVIKVMNFTRAYNQDVPDQTKCYNIRNGKMYINTDANVSEDKRKKLMGLFNLCCYVLHNRSTQSDSIKGHTFYIPAHINYATPISEKQMIDNIPYGTIISGDNASVIGIYWDNVANERVDIDFHLSSAGMCYGWNSSRRSSSIAYSGDMTDATNGAAECFYFDPTEDEILLASVYKYYGPDTEIPYKFIMTSMDRTKYDNKLNKFNRRGNTPFINMDEVTIPPVNMSFKTNVDSNTIGYIHGHSFVFYGGTFVHNRVPDREMSAKALAAICTRCESMLSLEEFITICGGNVIHEMPKDEEEQSKIINLDTASLTSSTLFEIVDSLDKEN